ncbi:MAG: peptidase MA family metallohydrolase [Pirellulales bacterium]
MSPTVRRRSPQIAGELSLRSTAHCFLCLVCSALLGMSVPPTIFAQTNASKNLQLPATPPTRTPAADVVDTPDKPAIPLTFHQLYRVGRYTEAIEGAGKAVTASYYDESAWTVKINSELELGRYADALATLDAGLAKLPNSLRLRYLGRDVCRFNGQLERQSKLETEITDLLKQAAWRYGDAANQVYVGRWLLSQGADPKKVLKEIYREIRRRNPQFVDAAIAIGELALAKHDYALAGDSYQQAVKLDADHPDAWWGVAAAFATSDSEKATAAITRALAINPRHVPSLLLLIDGHIDAERYDVARELLGKIREVNPHHPRAIAYYAVLAHLSNDATREKRLRDAALRYDAKNPEVDHLIGKKLSQKYRFAEGAAYQRQALEFAPQYTAAKTQLAQDLLRLGQEEEGLRLAQEVNQSDGYNVFAHNLVTLQEELAKFRTLERDGFQVRMDAREAEIYGDRVLELLTRAKRELSGRYDVVVAEPIIVELFPRQQDFAIRTFGMPGGAGFLGVCFGTVITANSPASQRGTPASWEATLWHEFCHAVTLGKTHNKMPRWLSEGISVYEERRADPSWGQSLDAPYRAMIVAGELTPVSQLSSAFLQPKSPLHLQFAYFESAWVVEYIVEKRGLETLQRILTDLSVGMPINESLARYFGSIETLDAEFADHARRRAEMLAPKVDWSTPELSRNADVATVQDWLQEHPDNYAALGKLADLQLGQRDWTGAMQTLERMRALYPEDHSPNSPLRLLASVYRQLEDNSKEKMVLEKLVELSASELGALERLATLAEQAEDWSAMGRYVERALGVQPLSAETQRQAALVAEKIGRDEDAIRAYRAQLSLDPIDPSLVHYRLALALRKKGLVDEAKRHALMALEQTPRYQHAQQLLLELVESGASR